MGRWRGQGGRLEEVKDEGCEEQEIGRKNARCIGWEGNRKRTKN
jgi:hypothetical protein